MKTFFYFFWSTPPNLRTKSVLKVDNIGFGANYSPVCCRISNTYGCVSVRLLKRTPKIFRAPRNTLLWRRACYYIVLLQCTNYSVVCDQIAHKSNPFVLLNGRIWGKYCGKPSLRSASLRQFIDL